MLAAHFKTDWRQADLDEPTRALLEFAVQLTRKVDGSQDEIDALRRHGWSDEQILQAAHITGFFNYYTRLVEALGCEPEDFMPLGPSIP